MITNEHIEKFIAEAHRVGDAGLTVCSSGNISWRVGDKILVSGTGSWVPSLPKEKVSICNLETGEVLNGVKPFITNGDADIHQWKVYSIWEYSKKDQM